MKASDVLPGDETLSEGWMEVEEAKVFGGNELRRRYCKVAGEAIIIYKSEAADKEKARVSLAGAHLRPLVAEVDSKEISGFEVLSRRGLTRSDLFMVGDRTAAKAWFRGVWAEIKAAEASLKPSLFVPAAPIGFNGRVLHMEWMQVHLRAKWVWRYCVLSDFGLSYYEDFPARSAMLALQTATPPSAAGGKKTSAGASAAVATTASVVSSGLSGLAPLVGSLRRDPQRDYGMPHVFVMLLPSGEKLPIACYSAERLRQWQTGIDMTARRAVQARLDAGELCFNGSLRRKAEEAPIPVEIVFLSMSRFGFRRAVTPEAKAAAQLAASNPLLHGDLEYTEAANALFWQRSFSQLFQVRRRPARLRFVCCLTLLALLLCRVLPCAQFRREKLDITFDFGTHEPDGPLLFASNAAHEICNIVALLFMERVRQNARKAATTGK